MIFPRFLSVIAILIALFAAPGRATETEKNPLQPLLSGQPCEIWDDPSGVPHVRAKDETQALACMGYVHARDRAWQMDFLKRIAQGRRSEILGSSLVKDDFRLRILGLNDHARRVFEKMTPEQQRPFWAYAYGVNQGLQTEQARSAYEFKHLGYQPETWHPADSLTLVLLQSFDQTRKGLLQDLDEAGWKERHGAAAKGLFNPDGLPWDTTILKPGEYPTRKEKARKSPEKQPDEVETTSLKRFLEPFFPMDQGEGSNNWVVAPARSKSGKAWLANDPHLGLKHPSFWHWVHLSGGRLDAIGASVPGIPAIVSGSNRHVAWGLTNAYLDVADVVYVPESELDQIETFRPVVWVKVWKLKLPIFFKSLQRTRNGWPILPIETPPGKRAVLRWTGLDLEPKDITPLPEVMMGESADELNRIFARVGIPTWNFVFADTHGSIGYRAVGRIPKRTEPPYFGIPDRRIMELENLPLLSAEEMPHVFRPKRDYVATANNQHWPSNSVFNGGRAYAPSFRANRIEQMLTSTKRHNLESLQGIQCDDLAVDAQYLLPKLLGILERTGSSPLGARERRVVDQLKGWDFRATVDCIPCSVYRRWVDRLMETLDMNISALYRAMANDADPELTPNARRSLVQALNDLKVDSSGELHPWGDVHRNAFPHFASDNLFRARSIPSPGDEFTVNPGTANWNSTTGSYEQVSGASQRLLVEMTSPPRVYAVLAGSNQDVADRQLDDTNGPWMKWQRCDMEQKVFPLDWKKVKTRKVAL